MEDEFCDIKVQIVVFVCVRAISLQRAEKGHVRMSSCPWMSPTLVPQNEEGKRDLDLLKIVVVILTRQLCK